MKKYKKLFLILSIIIIIGIIASFFVYKSIYNKVSNRIYYKSIKITQSYNTYYIEGYVFNESKLKFDNLYIDLVLEDNSSKQIDYQVFYGKLDGNKAYFKEEIYYDDFDFNNGTKVKQVFVKDSFSSEQIEIQSKDNLLKNAYVIYLPFYITILIPVIGMCILLFAIYRYTEYKANLHSVSMSIQNKPKKQALNITCPYCGFSASGNRCPKCGGNLLKQ